MKTIGVVGASGFVGKHLVQVLSEKYHVVALGRNDPKLGVEWRKLDLFSAQNTLEALKGIEVAFYLVHSMMPSSKLFQGNFYDTDLLLADNFAHACRINGVKQIIYLGGIVPSGHISEHLKGRKEVEEVLQTSNIPVTVFRAGMVVGFEGPSFDILYSLVQKLPMMLLPQWTRNNTQAIFIDDVIKILALAVDNKDYLGKTMNLVNGEELTYAQLLHQTATALNQKKIMIHVPINSVQFSKRWVQFFGKSSIELVSPLIDSLLCDFKNIEQDTLIKNLIEYTSFQKMLDKIIQSESGPKKTSKIKKSKILNQDSVRSIQRLPSINKDCLWIAMEYMNWLPKKFSSIIKTKVDLRSGIVEFFIVSRSFPLLVLQHIHQDSELKREKFHIIGGILSKTTNTGWLEFRQVNNNKYTIVAIHEFIPSLPWQIYILTQAPLHQWVMRKFGKHLKALGEIRIDF